MQTKLFSTTPIIKHSLATPLTNIIFNSELAIENLNKQHHYCPKNEINSVKLNAEYIKSVLYLSEKKQTYIFSPEKAIAEIIMMNDGSKLKQSLVSRISLPLKKHLLGNKLLFQEVIVCLINNAYESYQKNIKNKLVFLSAISKNDCCAISIVDAGKGMSWWEKNLAQLPFSSKKPHHSGLGLFFVKQTIEKEFAGKILINSIKNKGTTIELKIPFYN